MSEPDLGKDGFLHVAAISHNEGTITVEDTESDAEFSDNWIDQKMLTSVPIPQFPSICELEMPGLHESNSEIKADRMAHLLSTRGSKRDLLSHAYRNGMNLTLEEVAASRGTACGKPSESCNHHIQAGVIIGYAAALKASSLAAEESFWRSLPVLDRQGIRCMPATQYNARVMISARDTASLIAKSQEGIAEKDRGKLTGEIVHAALVAVVEEHKAPIHIVNSHWCTKKSSEQTARHIVQGVQTQPYYLLFPLNQGGRHWLLLVVRLDKPSKVVVFDSSKPFDPSYLDPMNKITEILMELQKIKPGWFGMYGGFTCSPKLIKTLQQTNNIDCGIHVLIATERWLRKEDKCKDFDTAFARYRFHLQILNNSRHEKLALNSGND